jgi:hypothetical protein
LGISPLAVEFHREIFSIPGYLSSPFLTIGFQETNRNGIAEDFDYPDLGALLHAKGVSEVVTLDYFDPRADLRYDLNKPVPVEARSRYRTVCDIGSLEHIFDTKQALENCMAMVTLGGFYFLTTPVKGYYGHGFHTFAPEMLIQVFILNGFEIVYEEYVRATGERIESPDDARNVHIYLVGRRVAHFPEFVIPQQTGWSERYEVQGPPGDLSLGTSEPGTFGGHVRGTFREIRASTA